MSVNMRNGWCMRLLDLRMGQDIVRMKDENKVGECLRLDLECMCG